MTPAIRVDHLSKTYQTGWRGRSVTAVRDVSLEVQIGEAFGFIGPNGAGKSSAIRILMGLSTPSSGSAEFFGMSVTEPAARKGVGYVPESPYLYDYMTPNEILGMSLQMHQVRQADRRGHIGGWLERLGLSAVVDTPIRSFSKGMVQRVAIAQALAIGPKLLVLDEPLSGLDPIGRLEVVELLAEYKSAGGTLFFTSHVLHDVERLADRFGLIHKGDLRSVNSPAELVGDDDQVLIRSTGVAEVAGMTVEGIGRWSGVFPRSMLWPQLEALRLGNHSVLEIKPTLSLEAAFLKIVGK